MPHLKPGNMGSPSGPPNAKPGDFANSMADAMDTAFHTLLKNEGMKRFELDTNSKEARDRRRLFVAIAQGVVRHLVDNPHALRVFSAGNVWTRETVRVASDTTLLGPAQPPQP